MIIIKKHNAFQLKMLLALLMVLDHLQTIPELLSPNMIMIFHILTRCVGVFFAYMAVEGFHYTRNRIKYNGRLFFWAGVVFIGNTILNQLFKGSGISLSHNIFFTLALGILMLNLLAFNTKNGWLNILIKGVLTIVVLFVGISFAEGGAVILPFILITYLFRDKNVLRNVLYVSLSAILLFMSYVPYETLEMTISMMGYNSDWLFITVFPLLHLYNGERGPKTKFSKYFFYVFYPAHLWILGIIGYLTTIN